MYVPNNPEQLSGIFSKVGKALKKVVKTASKLSLSQQVLKKVNPKLAPLLSSAPKAKPVIQAEAPTVPAIVTPPPPVSAPPAVAASPLPAVAPPTPAPAPPPAAESFAMPLAPTPSIFGPASFAPSSTPDTTAPAAPAPSSNLPLILGAAGLGLAALLFLGKKKGR